MAQQLAPVTVTGRATPPATIAGWGDQPLAKLPLQASVFTSEALRDTGGKRLSDLAGFDPAISDAYDTEGYWDYLTVRGFVIDNRYNYRRDGLPINAETSIPLDNKSRIEVLKGTSGMQAGTSAPGGLVNLVVKRPTDAPVRSAFLEWRQSGSVTGAVDLSQRFGTDNAFGVRLNAAAAHLDPRVRDAKGERNLFALAADWRVSSDTLLEAEIERSHRSQPSVPGFSMLGNTVPAPTDPRINLNNQPWTLPVVLDGTTGSLRWQQKLAADWRVVAHIASQRLTSDDRVAFPFGCSAEGDFHRYCSDGTFDFYDFRSEGEKRRIDAADVSLHGKLSTGGIEHALALGVLRSRTHDTLPPQAFNLTTAPGNIDGTAIVPANPATFGDTTFRDERSTELYVRDAIAFDPRWTAWLGARHSRIERGYTQSFTSPSVALSFAYARDQMVYVSWGRGVESAVAPSLPMYTNASQVLPALQSRQAEVGLKGATGAFEWNVALFDISRPLTADIGACDASAVTPTCTRTIDGKQRHRGIEANAGWRGGPWSLQAGAQWLRARVEGSSDATIDGKQPTNVPARTLKAQLGYDVPALPGLSVRGRAVYESERQVLPDNSAQIPGWTRFDADARYETKVAGVTWTWRAGVDNLFDKRAWRESPYQFSHVYLFPLAPRTFRVSVQADL
ncbi:MAG TPA: TonB-dependent siderophore receptor [Burkholderiaceae bacterium]|nr:TonB-dependent siderophore receptor [Burkholderiaceae bacterium]